MMTSRRGKNVALIGAAGELIFAVVMLIAWTWANSAAARACTLMLLCGALLWLMVALLLYCRQLAEREQVELRQLAEEASASIFEGEGLTEQRLAARRVAIIERWVVPVFTLAWAATNATVGYLLLKAARSAAAPDVISSGPASLLVIVAGFGAFLFSCYALGMARQVEWRPLRAPASYLLISTLMIAGTIAALILATRKLLIVDLIVAYVVPAVQLILAAEMVLNFILDRYRPRVAGGEERLSFDSRLLNLLAEPKRVGHSIAETLNYQFGFEVSQTWFYQLLQRAFVPLLIFAAALLLGVTALVPVGPGQSAVITHLGKMRDRPVGPGLHLKWPWPIDTAKVYAQDIQTMHLGMGEHREHRGELMEGGTFQGRELALWTQEHGEHEEMNFVVAVERGQKDTDEHAPPVDVIRLTAVLNYRVVDPVKFGYRFVDARAMLNCLANREMVRYCSSATLFEDLPADQAGVRPQAIMTHGREAMARELKKRIQSAIDDPSIDLGIEITSLNFQAVHPPPEIAPAFEEVLSARLGQQTQRYEAEADAAEKFINAAGDPVLAQKLALALRKRENLINLMSLQAKGDKQAFDASLKNIISSVDDHLVVLTRDVTRENLMGGAGEQGARDVEEVLAALSEYRQVLANIQRDQQVDLLALIAQAQQEADKLFDNAGGRSAVLMAEAGTDRWRREMQERSRASTFPAELRAYRASPDLYALDRYLDVWDEVLPRSVKYVVGFDPARLEPWLNLERSQRVEQRLTFDESDVKEP